MLADQSQNLICIDLDNTLFNMHSHNTLMAIGTFISKNDPDNFYKFMHNPDEQWKALKGESPYDNILTLINAAKFLKETYPDYAEKLLDKRIDGGVSQNVLLDKNNPEMTKWLQENIPPPELIAPIGDKNKWRDVLTALVEHDQVALTSFNSFPGIIPLFLEKELGLTPDVIEKIHVQAWLPAESSTADKNKHIEQARRALFGDAKPNSITLVDDSKPNIDKAKEKGFEVCLANNDADQLKFLSQRAEESLKKSKIPYSTMGAIKARNKILREMIAEIKKSHNGKLTPNEKHEVAKLIQALKDGLVGTHKNLKDAKIIPADIKIFRQVCHDAKALFNPLVAAKSAGQKEARDAAYQRIKSYKTFDSDVKQTVGAVLASGANKLQFQIKRKNAFDPKSDLVKGVEKQFSEKSKEYQFIAQVAVLNGESQPAPAGMPAKDEAAAAMRYLNRDEKKRNENGSLEAKDIFYKEGKYVVMWAHNSGDIAKNRSTFYSPDQIRECAAKQLAYEKVHGKAQEKAQEKAPEKAQEKTQEKAQGKSHEKNIICVRDEKKGEDRYVTVIGKFPFYQSTGNNSGEKDTWFPFRGSLESSLPDRTPKGHFLKPLSEVSTFFFPQNLIDHMKSAMIPSKFVERFGSFDAMCLSMLIGGGFWKGEQGKELAKFINAHFAEEVKFISNQHQQIISEIKTCSDNKNILTIDLHEPKQVNDWLEKYITIKGRGELFADIRFKYSSHETATTPNPSASPSAAKPSQQPVPVSRNPEIYSHPNRDYYQRNQLQPSPLVQSASQSKQQSTSSTTVNDESEIKSPSIKPRSR